MLWMPKASHRSKECVCTVCKRRHPTLLHGDRNQSDQVNVNSKVSEDNTAVSSHTTSVCHLNLNKDIAKSTMVVPVWLSHQSNPTERMVYALLDTQSDTSFILESTKNAMGLRGLRLTSFSLQ